MSKTFDPSAVAVRNGNFFGFPTALSDADLVILGVPWDVTTSYRDGTSRGPEAVLAASYQLDFHSPIIADAWKLPIGTAPVKETWLEQNKKFRAVSSSYIRFLEEGGDLSANPAMRALLSNINAGSEAFHSEVKQEITKFLKNGQRVLLLGGDHSTSISAFEALAERGESFSILHIDAHADLRNKYEGFSHSHASIMHRALELQAVDRIAQVGIRDVAPDEVALIQKNPKLRTFFDWDLQADRFRGVSWRDQCDLILGTLSKNVYVSFDVDGLDPQLCPHTGTPVPGGLSFAEASYLLQRLAESGRRIVGADLVEVAPGPEGDEWDANVGARVLFQLCMSFFRSWR